MDNRIGLLLIEDNQGDVRLIQEMLRDVTHIKFAWTDTLADGVARAATGDVDVIILDLGLPDSSGIDTFRKLRESSPNIPIVINTGNKDDEAAIEAVKAGAQDYLVKGVSDKDSLVRSVKYAIERHRLLGELERARRREEMARESRALEQIRTAALTSAVPKMYSESIASDNARSIFEELVNLYSALLDMSLEGRDIETNNRISEYLRQMASQIGGLRAGPGDVIKIHRTALTQKTAELEIASLASTYSEEARFLVLELMGHMVAFYRKISAAPEQKLD